MNGWTTPKDLILHIAGRLTVRVSTAFVSHLFRHPPALSTFLKSSNRLNLYRVELAESWNTSAQESSRNHALV